MALLDIKHDLYETSIQAFIEGKPSNIIDVAIHGEFADINYDGVVFIEELTDAHRAEVEQQLQVTEIDCMEETESIQDGVECYVYRIYTTLGEVKPGNTCFIEIYLRK